MDHETAARPSNNPPSPSTSPSASSSTETLAAAETAAEKRKFNLACDRCRSKKRKCDGAKPICSNCRRAIDRNVEGVTCVYVPTAKKRGPKKGYRDALMEKLNTLESLLRPLQEGQRGSSAGGSSGGGVAGGEGSLSAVVAGLGSGLPQGLDLSANPALASLLKGVTKEGDRAGESSLATGSGVRGRDIRDNSADANVQDAHSASEDEAFDDHTAEGVSGISLAPSAEDVSQQQRHQMQSSGPQTLPCQYVMEPGTETLQSQYAIQHQQQQQQIAPLHSQYTIQQQQQQQQQQHQPLQSQYTIQQQQRQEQQHPALQSQYVFQKQQQQHPSLQSQNTIQQQQQQQYPTLHSQYMIQHQHQQHPPRAHPVQAQHTVQQQQQPPLPSAPLSGVQTGLYPNSMHRQQQHPPEALQSQYIVQQQQNPLHTEGTLQSQYTIQQQQQQQRHPPPAAQTLQSQYVIQQQQQQQQHPPPSAPLPVVQTGLPPHSVHRQQHPPPSALLHEAQAGPSQQPVHQQQQQQPHFPPNRAFQQMSTSTSYGKTSAMSTDPYQQQPPLDRLGRQLQEQQLFMTSSQSTAATFLSPSTRPPSSAPSSIPIVPDPTTLPAANARSSFFIQPPVPNPANFFPPTVPPNDITTAATLPTNMPHNLEAPPPQPSLTSPLTMSTTTPPDALVKSPAPRLYGTAPSPSIPVGSLVISEHIPASSSSNLIPPHPHQQQQRHQQFFGSLTRVTTNIDLNGSLMLDVAVSSEASPTEPIPSPQSSENNLREGNGNPQTSVGEIGYQKSVAVQDVGTSAEAFDWWLFSNEAGGGAVVDGGEGAAALPVVRLGRNGIEGLPPGFEWSSPSLSKFIIPRKLALDYPK
ncbi:hypothetical protein HK102_001951 [Quaeritorhiza haematococci]|nr:hypothetical protein HK102_001951 [Quaeritorhiza haematococci]